MKHSRIIVGVAVVACCAVVAAGIWQERREATFAPWARDMVAPVTVGWGADLDAYAPEIHQAIAATNAEVGCQVLLPSGPSGTITLITFATREACGGAHADHPEKPSTVLCGDGVSIDIQLNRLGEAAMTYLIVRHELGHALGLAHDDGGLMAPALTSTDLPLPSLSPRDRKALRAKFCRP